jgi:hypothetical protein
MSELAKAEARIAQAEARIAELEAERRRAAADRACESHSNDTQAIAERRDCLLNVGPADA